MPLKVIRPTIDPLGDKLRRKWAAQTREAPPKVRYKPGDKLSVGDAEFHISQVAYIGTGEPHYAGCMVTGPKNRRNWGWVHALFLDNIDAV
jgi:hypothetical protein